MGRQIIDEYSEPIIADLCAEFGIESDGIEDRMFVSASAHCITTGQLYYQYHMDGYYHKYTLGSASITLFPLVSQFKYINGKRYRIPLCEMIPRSVYKMFLIKNLIHELRHWAQLVTGKIFYHDMWFNGESLIEYGNRWSEHDAQSYSIHYITNKLK